MFLVVVMESAEHVKICRREIQIEMRGSYFYPTDSQRAGLVFKGPETMKHLEAFDS